MMTTPLSVAALRAPLPILTMSQALLPQTLAIGHHLGGLSPEAYPNDPHSPPLPP